jgi:hypothetical protein
MSVMCDACGFEHGPLYLCPSYPPERQEEIKAKQAEWETYLKSPNAVQEMGEEAWVINCWFADLI